MERFLRRAVSGLWYVRPAAGVAEPDSEPVRTWLSEDDHIVT